MPLHLHCPSLCFWHHLHLCGLLYSTYIFVDRCYFASTMFSFASLCTIYASPKCYSIASSSFDSSMNIKSINVAFGFVCFLARQHFLLMCKKSTIDVLIVSMFQIIVWQIIYFHYMPSLMHILKMMMNVAMTSQMMKTDMSGFKS